MSSNSNALDICRIGTRGSRLALWQAETIQEQLSTLGIESRIEVIKTQGDRIDDVPFSQLEGKGFFTKELEDAQLAGRVDVAVHSLKDLATEMPSGLTLVAMVGREDSRDVLLARNDVVDAERVRTGEVLPILEGTTIGTSAVRRQAQIYDLRRDLTIADLRGNVPTRVDKLRKRKYGAIVLAQAGLVRLKLKLDDLFVKPLDIDRFVPAPAQGMMGVQCQDKEPWRTKLAQLHCPEEGQAVAAERGLLERLEGGCQLPFGVNIRKAESEWRLEAFLASSSTDDSPLRLSLAGADLDTLAEQAWQRLRRGA